MYYIPIDKYTVSIETSSFSRFEWCLFQSFSPPPACTKRMITSSREVAKEIGDAAPAGDFHLEILMPIGRILIFQPRALEEVLRRKREGGDIEKVLKIERKNIALGPGGRGKGGAMGWRR